MSAGTWVAEHLDKLGRIIGGKEPNYGVSCAAPNRVGSKIKPSTIAKDGFSLCATSASVVDTQDLNGIVISFYQRIEAAVYFDQDAIAGIEHKCSLYVPD